MFLDKKRKSALEKLYLLDKKIPLLSLKEERQNFDQKKREMYAKIEGDAPVEEVGAAIDDLLSKVERYVRIQQDEDYSRIIEHLARKNIDSEVEIKEICDPLDRNIVFKYLQAQKEKIIGDILKILSEKLSLVEEIFGSTRRVISQEKDAEELRSTWNNILQEEQDKLDNLKNIYNNLKNNLKTIELDAAEHEVSDLIERLACLEKYGKDYLCEKELEEFTNEVKDYIPREDIAYEYIYEGLGGSIVIELKKCIGRENEGKIIKERMAKLIYGRLKKGMFVM